MDESMVYETMAQVNFPVNFEIERYFNKHFDKVHNLSYSDSESLGLQDMLGMADAECLDLWENMTFGYTDMKGHPKLREEVAKLHHVKKDEVLEVTPIEGIFVAMHCLVPYLKSKNNISKIHVVTTFPAYQSLQENLRQLDCDVGNWNIWQTKNEWYFDLADLKSLIREDTKLIVVNFPHNPTGTVISATEWQNLVDLCKEKDIFLFSDEMYSLLLLDGSEPQTSACALYENSITLFGVSKTFSMPGLRLGWLCTQNAEIMDMMRRFKDYTSSCGALPSEIMGIITLRNRTQIVGRAVDICNNNLNVLDTFFNSYPDLFEWRRPKAGTTGFLKIKGWLLELGGGGASGFCEVLAREAGVVLLPGSVYKYDDEYIRIGYGRKSVPDTLLKLKVFLDTKLQT